MLRSIFARTFLLMLVTVIVAQTTAALLPGEQGPRQLTPRIEDIARQLRPRQERPPPGEQLDGNQPPMPPPGFQPGLGPGEDRGPPPGLMSRDFGDYAMRTSTTPPSPGAPYAASAAQQAELAGALGFSAEQVRVYTKTTDGSLGASFIAAVQQPDHRWRIVEHAAESFPTMAQRRALGIFALELVALLPLAWLFARALSAPIRRFAEAARRVGQDSSSAPLPREGPKEMQLAVDAFNAMQSRLNRLVEERTRMVGAIAHDLRTPLTRLAFRLDDLPEPLGERVHGDIQEMKSMISAALDFIRDRALNAQRERLDLRLLVERVVNDLADLGHDVTLQAGLPVTVEGVPLALRRLVTNLAENALKYGDRARLRLSTQGDVCQLEVDDDGPGIPENLQEQVFEPFFRVEGSRNRDTGGIGLGLAAVRAIAIEHGGSATRQSQRGRSARYPGRANRSRLKCKAPRDSSITDRGDTTGASRWLPGSPTWRQSARRWRGQAMDNLARSH